MSHDDRDDFVAPPSPEVGSGDFNAPPPPDVGDVNPESFDFNPDSIPSPSAKKPFPWKLAALIAGIVVVVGLIVGGIFLLIPGITEPSPVKTVEQYYTAWQAKDFQAMSDLQDPTSKINAVKLGDTLFSGIKSIFGDVNIDLKWEFSDLKFELLSNDHSTAKVLASGTLHFSAFGLIDSTKAYQKIHELTKIDGKWYIKP